MINRICLRCYKLFHTSKKLQIASIRLSSNHTIKLGYNITPLNICKSVKTVIKNYSTETQSENEEVRPNIETNLYPDHIPTTDFQKCLLTAGSAILALTDPFRDDMVAVLGETTGSKALANIMEKMRNNDEGQQILLERPRINSSTVDFDELRSMPVNSLGNVYITFMDKYNITADSRRPVHFVDNEELAYVMVRYREIHDLVHALLAMPTNMLGEVTVKWVEAIQTELPMCIGAAIFGAVRLKPKQTENYKNIMLPWALDCGKNASFLMNVYFEKRWQQDVDDLRTELNIPAIPVL